MTESRLIYRSARGLAETILTKEASAEEVVEACLSRIKATNGQLNAVVQLAEESARIQARKADAALARGEIKGSLHGVPMSIKDSFDTAGIISTGGTKGRATFVPSRDATVVARLRAAGAILLGKTNTPELTLSDETDNLIYGHTSNPYDLSRSAGGSSGGAGAIIAAGGSPLDLGSDTGGSIRTPSHFCGIAGLKPTSGLVPKTGHIVPPGGLLGALTQVGPMARRVEDLMLTLPIIAGEDGLDHSVVPVPLKDPMAVDINNLHVAFYADNGIASSTPETHTAVKAAANVLSDAGAITTEARPECIEQTDDIFMDLVSADGGAWVRRQLELAGTTEVHPFLARLQETQHASEMSMAEYTALIEKWDVFRKTMLAFLEKFKVIICPVNAFPALPHGFGLASDEETSHSFSYARTYNLTGWPSVVVRAGTSLENLPIGVQVVAGPWRDEFALATAERIEAALGGWRPPPL